MVTVSEIAIPAIAVAAILKLLPLVVEFCHYVYHILQIPTAPEFIPILGHSVSILRQAYNQSCSIPVAMHMMGKRMREDRTLIPDMDEYGCFKLWILCYPIVVVTSAETASVFYQSRSLPKSWLVVKHLGSVIRGFFAMNGDKFRYHKKLLAPQFNYSLMQRLPSIVACNMQSLIKVIDDGISRSSDGSCLIHSVQHQLDPILIRVLLTSAMGFSEKQIQEHFTSEYINKLAHLVNSMFGLTMNRVFAFFVPDFLYNLTSEGKEFVKEKAKYDAFADHVFNMAKVLDKEWSQETKAQEDKSFLQVLYEEHKRNPHSFTREDVVEEFKTFFAAGFESMVTTVAWLLHFVGNFPHIQERMIQELDEVFEADADREASVDDIKDMKYVEAVVRECLRLHSVVPALSRTADKDYVIKSRSGEKEFTIPKWADLVLYQYIIQRDPHHWPDPLNFEPERFLTPQLPHSHAFVAFSSGYRSCMGQRYAIIVMVATVSQLFRRYRCMALQPIGSLVGRPLMSLVPEKDVEVVFRRRDSLSELYVV